ncbi:hypothetical protein D0B54_13585 [Solimonas sp. K1W22B-7]|uniref:glycosyltransferase n=1 Tax=Solimonas sp. K1W22B-7 TaxID=2303331 RepID=UPI000E33249D|nr:nucleotide disphospho-sugar-binding domain-containing protein [Solimonas sp. K1W22B-7]AXQ29648.1 hypothetical protein D0B54_13585 [Solimonas sp. K1W22B-7]
MNRRPAPILLATELGNGQGHLAPIGAIAAHLTGRGQPCLLATHQPETAQEMGLYRYAPILPAPTGSAGIQSVRVQASYASLLHNCGWHGKTALAGRLRAWCSLLQLSGARALLVDHAPTALLAARVLKLPVAAVGTGFCLPPPRGPFPAYPGVPAREQRLRDNEAHVLAVANGALAELGAEPLPSLQSLFAGVELGLKTYAELDHYGPGREADWLGLPDFSSGLPAEWGESREPRIFAYLRAGEGLEALLAALQASRAQVLVRLADIPLEMITRYERPGMRITDRNIWLRQAVETCDGFVGSGSHGAVAEALLAGKPCLVQYSHTEQRLVAERVEAIGAGLALATSASESFGTGLQRLLDDSTLHHTARQFAARYAGRDRQGILPRWADGWMDKLAA